MQGKIDGLARCNDIQLAIIIVACLNQGNKEKAEEAFAAIEKKKELLLK